MKIQEATKFIRVLGPVPSRRLDQIPGIKKFLTKFAATLVSIVRYEGLLTKG
jgi:hypothetical protein